MTFDLKKSRLQAGLTQEQLADAVGIARTQVTKWESGAVSPTVVQLEKIAKALRLSPSDLVKSTTSIITHDVKDSELQTIIQLVVEAALKNPKLSPKAAAACAITIYRAARDGTLPELAKSKKQKSAAKPFLQQLIAHELGRAT